MPIEHNYLRTRVRVANIVSNYELLRQNGGQVVAVVKADAYGHGLIATATALAAAGCESFAIGSAAEGAALRDAGCSAAIISLLGPVLPEDDELVIEKGLIPFIHDFEQLSRLAERCRAMGRTARVALKFDTGMARLGFTEAQAEKLAEVIGATPWLEVAMVSSHLATADDPAAFDFVAEQGARFARICQTLRRGGLTFRASLCNSAGILAHAGSIGFDARRAGIALYGVNPFAGSDHEGLGRGLLPAMETVTRLVSVHDLPRGASISYGRAFVAERDMRVAIVAAGYADAYSRGLSNQGFMCLAGRRVPILGRVCMQLTAVDVTGLADVRPGDVIHLLGGDGPGTVAPDDLASWWGTIAYEVFCLLGLNPREYV
ncbi:alanine racemase [Desulfovibrio aerotolerans]|uniref:Alanine racemase n=1 Tax=Solidesulfovibrio aerotolerans TaxID=295255 RepID=A0A7C9IJ80_9BACT|nr:alanine racemase [Solidesulfovibrio aerotolerans]MYL82025.1 alanine racemase [Solidesulfovibrio aerotolerans]